MAQFSLFAALPPAARWRVRRAFEQAGAYSPEKAIAYEPPHWFEHRYFKRLREHGAVVEVQRGRYYADAPKLAEYVRKRRLRAFILASATILAAVMTAKRVLLH
jgi:hypothetical protein